MFNASMMPLYYQNEPKRFKMVRFGNDECLTKENEENKEGINSSFPCYLLFRITVLLRRLLAARDYPGIVWSYPDQISDRWIRCIKRSGSGSPEQNVLH